jgi:hypothetical protein
MRTFTRWCPLLSVAILLGALPPLAHGATFTVQLFNLARQSLADDPKFKDVTVTVTIFEVFENGREVRIQDATPIKNKRTELITVGDDVGAVRLVFEGQGLRTARIDGLLNVPHTLSVAMPEDESVCPPPPCCCVHPVYPCEAKHHRRFWHR